MSDGVRIHKALAAVLGADPVVVPVVVHADDLIGREFTPARPPHDLALRPVRRDRAVVPGQPPHRVRQHVIGHLRAVRRTREVVEDLPALLVESVHPGYAVQSGRGEVVEQSVDRRRPRPGRAPDRPTDAHRAADVATGQRYLGVHVNTFQ